MRRILVGYDGSPGGRRALDRAIAEARDSRGRITVLSVLDVPLDPNVPRNFGTLDDISAWEGAQLTPPAEVVDLLTDARDVLGAAGFDTELTWAAGEPASAIVETAQRLRTLLRRRRGCRGAAPRRLRGDPRLVAGQRALP